MISVQTTLIRLGLALLLGALVGLERERGERTAGLRTHALVALGSCLIMIVSAFGFADILGTHNVVLDPSRIAAQVVSGIGFLGAGTILLRKEIVKGLTTAAAIWVVAAIGLACGAGLLVEAVLTTVFTIAVLTLLNPLRRRLHPPEVYHLRIKVTAVEQRWRSNAQREKLSNWQSLLLHFTLCQELKPFLSTYAILQALLLLFLSLPKIR